MKKQTLFLIFFQIFLAFQLRSQAVCYGSVYNENTPASGAFISLVLRDSLTMKKFTAADEDGKWAIKNIPKGDYFLNVRYLGCKELFYPISIKNSDSLLVKLILETDAILLAGAEVKANAIGIAQSGDTLKFNLKYFSSGAEISLGDVLNQLPGIEVTENGTVNYAGKKVDKLLIHGKDILNNKHKLATESIRADQLEGVLLINDYRDVKDIETKKSGDVALDVRIKKSEREKWSGQLQAWAGYDKKWATDFSAFQVGEKLGMTLFAKANNVGEQTMSAQDYLGLKGYQILHKMKPYGQIEDLLPKGFRIAPQTTNNLDAVIAGGLDYDFNDQKSIKGDFILAQLNRDEQESFVRKYNRLQDVWSGKQLTESVQPILSGRVLSENKLSKQFFVKVGISGNYEKNDWDKQTKGLYNTKAFELYNQQAKKQWGVVPEFKIKYFPNKKIRLRWQVAYSNNQKNRATRLSDITPFLDLNLTPQNGLYAFEQTMDYHRQKWVSFIDFTYELKKAWYWGIESSNELGNYQKEYRAPDNTFSGKVELAQNLNAYKFKLVLDTTKWLIKTGITLVDNRVTQGLEQEKQPLKLVPNLTLKYLFSRLNFLMFTLNTYEEVTPEQYGHSVLEIVDSRQTKSYDIDWQKSSRRHSYALSYMNFGLGRGRMIYALTTYTVTKNPIGTSVANHSDYAQMRLIRLPQQATFTLRLNYRNRLTKWLFATAKYNLMDLDGYGANQMDIFGIHRTSHRLQIGLSSKWKKKINYRIDYALNITQQQFGVTQIFHKFIRHIPKMELSFGDKKGFLWKGNLTYQKSFSESMAIQSWRLDTDISYKKKGKKIRWFIKGRNLLNLTPLEQLDIRFSPNYIEEISYHSFPGYILLGGSREF